MLTHIIGQSRIGRQRDLKFVLEEIFNSNFSDLDEKSKILKELKRKIIYKNWKIKINNYIDYLNIRDFSFYDNILDNIFIFNFIPKRFNNNIIFFKKYFECVKGNDTNQPMEMSKWFNTNYHYVVPEYTIETKFLLNVEIIEEDIKYSKIFKKEFKFIITGIFTLLKIGKIKDNFLKNRLLLLPCFLKEYIKLLNYLNNFKNIKLIQIDEPIIVLNLSNIWIKNISNVYNLLCCYFTNIIFTTYFEDINKNFINYLKKINFFAIHTDNTVGKNKIFFKENYINFKNISLGLINGRNIWINNLENSWYILKKFIISKKKIILSTSCSMIHIPIDKYEEKKKNKKIFNWLSFGNQKIKELKILKNLEKNFLNKEKNSFFCKNFIKNIFYIKSKKNSRLIFVNKIQKKIKNININFFKYRINQKIRNVSQKKYFRFEDILSTTIGSFPQTKKIRKIRSDLKNNIIKKELYENLIKREIWYIIKKQCDIKLDVLVHGEPERSDMVEYFANLLEGFTTTANGWVQSYGTRYVKPPIIYGDIYIEKYITINWIKYSQKITEKPVKGMLTGPLTMIKWSFNREDQPIYITAIQIAMVLNKEILKLQKIGIKIIQIDEPAVKEFLPLKSSNHYNYFNWFIKTFLLVYKNLNINTQIHSHVCYSDFKNILFFIKALDIDVISIETSRSNFEIISNLDKQNNNIGLGIYDIHTFKKLNINRAIYLIKLIINNINIEKIWINPDCGLKTRKWKEINKSLINLTYSIKNIKEKILK